MSTSRINYLACTTGPICSPKAGESWFQDQISSVIWNTESTAPFDKYEKVDMYVFDDTTQAGTKLLSDVDLSRGMAAVTLESGLFPDHLPVNRSCHILLTRVDNDLDGTHQTLNSSAFFLIRTKQNVSGTLVPLPSATSTTTSLTPPSSSASSSSSSSSTSKNPKTSSSDSPFDAHPTGIPEGPESNKSNAISPLVIGLISAGCAALLIAILALGLLYRARRRYTGNNASYFKSLNDHPSSPTEPSKSSIFQNDDANGSFVGPTFGAAAGRSSSNTARSGDPMLKNGLFGYNNQSTVSTTAPVPLLERKGSSLQKEQVPEPTPVSIPTVIVGGYDSGSTTTRGSLENKSVPKLEPVLSAGDAALIAETFRKSMRRPRWDDGDEEEEDEARKAANELLRKELSEEGVDVRRGVQRRVTIQDRTDRAHRSSVAPPVAEADEH
ncbi:hypothetical protein BG005_002320 [Podila minutissima]|nr:hypothetical protein BG005_002320 [Podila minutissima]